MRAIETKACTTTNVADLSKSDRLSLKSARDSIVHLSRIGDYRRRRSPLRLVICNMANELHKAFGGAQMQTYEEAVHYIHQHYCSGENLPVFSDEELALLTFSFILLDVQEHWYQYKAKYVHHDNTRKVDLNTKKMQEVVGRTGLTCEEFTGKIGLENFKDMMYDFIRLRALYAYSNAHLVDSKSNSTKKLVLTRLQSVVQNRSLKPIVDDFSVPVSIVLTEAHHKELRPKNFKDPNVQRRFKEFESFARGDKMVLVDRIREAIGVPIKKIGITCFAQNFNLIKDQFKERPERGQSRVERIREVVKRCPELIKLVEVLVEEDGGLCGRRPEENETYGAAYHFAMLTLKTPRTLVINRAPFVDVKVVHKVDTEEVPVYESNSFVCQSQDKSNADETDDKSSVASIVQGTVDMILK